MPTVYSTQPVPIVRYRYVACAYCEVYQVACVCCEVYHVACACCEVHYVAMQLTPNRSEALSLIHI